LPNYLALSIIISCSGKNFAKNQKQYFVEGPMLVLDYHDRYNQVVASLQVRIITKELNGSVSLGL